MTKKTTLPNGVRLIYQNIEHVRSVSAGIWVDCGSKNETPENYHQILTEYRESYKRRKEAIDTLFDEIKIIKKLKV